MEVPSRARCAYNQLDLFNTVTATNLKTICHLFCEEEAINMRRLGIYGASLTMWSKDLSRTGQSSGAAKDLSSITNDGDNFMKVLKKSGCSDFMHSCSQ